MPLTGGWEVAGHSADAACCVPSNLLQFTEAMCGILGIYGHSPVGQSLYDGLVLLQHRGQDAAGIVTCDAGRIYQRKGNGLVRDVFDSHHLHGLRGNVGIGHVRYPTSGTNSASEAQPFYVNSPYGITLAHNGNLTNSEPLIAELFDQDRRHINTDSDSEILLNVFAHELLNQRSLMPGPRDIFNAVRRVHDRCRGAYAAVGLLAGHGLLAFRDPHGIRPLIYGVRGTATPEYMFASESAALHAFGFEIVRDVAPGEAIYIDRDGTFYAEQCARAAHYNGCIFEYVYFARPDSVIDGVFVHKARMRMGRHLAHKVARQWPDHDIDVVIPVPDTSRTAALEFAVQLGVRYREGFIKNRYIGRTFIMPWQTERQKSVRQKLNPLEPEFKGKNVLIVDDSIVRGTTSRQIVQMARAAGANKVYFMSASPPVRYPNIYGIDMPVAGELIANQRTVEDVRRMIGADRLIYQDLPALVDSVRAGNPALKKLDCSVFDGHYVVDPQGDYFDQLKRRRDEGTRRAHGRASILRSVG